MVIISSQVPEQSDSPQINWKENVEVDSPFCLSGTGGMNMQVTHNGIFSGHENSARTDRTSA